MKTLSLPNASFKELCEKILHAGTTIRFTANGSSMLPLIKDNDSLLITPVTSNQIRFGDVLLFVNDLEIPLVHRVIRIEKHSNDRVFEMKGDQAQSTDGWITTDQILGRLEAFTHAGNNFSVRRFDFRILSLFLALRGRYSWFGKLRLPLIQKMFRLLPSCTK